jgi:uncharacterized protein YndB with AHSA1/START domain
MTNRNISYVIHIAATPEELWDALTSREVLERNWGRIDSRWTPGSTVTEIDDSGKILWKGEVLQSVRPRVLSYTFDVTDAGERPTEVTFELDLPASDIAPDARVVRLRLTQAGFDSDSKVFAGCERAWPEILSSVKTYVETGRPLGFAWKH